MGWDIKVWHEDVEGGTRLSIEAGPQVPEEVISSVAGSYWFQEIQFTDDAEWDEDDEAFPEEPEGGPTGYHG